MYDGLRTIDYTLVGWGWMLWDWNWFRARTADSTLARIAARVSPGDIIVMHDGDESAPRKDQRQTVEATASLIPELRDRGFAFGTVCENGVVLRAANSTAYQHPMVERHHSGGAVSAESGKSYKVVRA